MKSKKLISLLCAAALTTSTFAGLVTTASAADSVLYSNNFNGYTKDIPIAVAYSAQAGWADANREPFLSYINLNVPTSAVVENAEDGDNAITIACGTSNDDDTTGVYIREKTEGDNYVAIPKGRFGKQGNTVVHFGEEVTDENSGKSYTYFTANDGEDLLVAFDMMLTLNGTDRSDQTIELSFGDLGSYNYVAEDEAVWKEVRVITKADGTSAVYIGGTQVLTGTGAVNTMTVVMPSSGDKASNGKYPLVNIDDMVVMSVAAGTAETVTVPDAKSTGEVAVATLPPAAEKASAPTLSAPAGITPVFSDDFNGYSKSTLLAMGKESQEANTTIDGMSLKIGARGDGGDSSGASITEWVSGDKVLKLTAGQYSTAGRGIVATMTNDLSEEFANGETIAMTFMVNLGTTAKTGVGRLYFIKDTTQTGSDSNGAYRNLAAVLTTDDTVFYRGDNESSDRISATVTADEWHKVTFVVSSGKYRVYIDDDYDEASISAEYIASGDNASTMTALPMLALTSASSSGSPTYSSVVIDNMMTYSGAVDNPKHLLPSTGEAPTPAPTKEPVPQGTMTLDTATKTVSMTSDMDATAYLVQASYDTDGVLVGVKTAKEVTLKASEPVTETLETLTVGDKIMLWNSAKGMTPVATAITVAEGQGDAQATPAPTYTVTGTVDAGVASVTLKSDDNTYTGTIADTAVTFTGVVAGTYTVTVTAKSGYENATAAPATVTVTDANVENAFTATATAEEAVAYADGTATYDNDGATALFTAVANCNNSVVQDGTNGNSTKIENVAADGKSYSRAHYIPFNIAGYRAEGEVKVSFDYNVTSRAAQIWYVNSDADLSGSNSTSTANTLLKMDTGANGAITITSGSDSATVNVNVLTGWVHVDSVVDTTAKKTTIKVYNYKANNNYANETPVYSGELAFADSNVTDFAGLYMAGSNGMGIQIDNVSIVDEDWTAPMSVAVTAPSETDGTLTADKTSARAGETVKVTPVAAKGKKVTGVTVAKAEGTVEVTANEDGTYSFTMPAGNVTVTATFKEIVKIAAVSVNSTNPDTTVTDQDALMANCMKVNSLGQLAANGGNSVTLIKINTNGEAAGRTLKTAVLDFTATCTASGKNSAINIARLSGIDDISSATWNTVLGKTMTHLGDLGSADASGSNKTCDLSADLIANGGVGVYAIYTGTAREQKITNIALTTTYGMPVTFTSNVNEGEFNVVVKNASGFEETFKVTNGSGSIVLAPGEYTYEIAEQNGYSSVSATAFTVTETGGSVMFTLEESADPLYNVTINTAPFATVVLDAGTSTAGTTVETQTVTATVAGVATLANVPAGNYTIDVTSKNTYLNSLTDSAITVASDALTIDKPLSYKAEYANMLFGDSFDYDAVELAGVSGTFGVISNSSNKWSGLSVSAGGEKVALNIAKVSGNFAYYNAGYNSRYTLTFNPAETVKKVSFDGAFGAQVYAGSTNTARGTGATTYTLGNIVMTITPADLTTGCTATTAVTVTITDGETTKTATSTLTACTWAKYVVEVGDSNAVTVKITPNGGETETIDGLTLSADATAFTFTGDAKANFVFDNMEIYGATAE